MSSAAGEGEMDQRLPSNPGSSTMGKSSTCAPAAVGIVLVLKGLTQTGSEGVEMNVALTTCGPCKMQLSSAQDPEL